MYAVMIFGIPGAGKSTQAQKLMDVYPFTHIETSALIWEALGARNDCYALLPDGTRVDLDEQERRMNAGELTNAVWVFDLVCRAIEKAADVKRSIVLSGFPRRVIVAQKFLPVLEKHFGQRLTVFLLEIPREEAERRVYARGRALDEHFLRHMQIFEEETKPVFEWLAGQGLFVYRIDGTKAEEKIAAEIAQIVFTKPKKDGYS